MASKASKVFWMRPWDKTSMINPALWHLFLPLTASSFMVLTRISNQDIQPGRIALSSGFTPFWMKGMWVRSFGINHAVAQTLKVWVNKMKEKQYCDTNVTIQKQYTGSTYFSFQSIDYLKTTLPIILWKKSPLIRDKKKIKNKKT